MDENKNLPPEEPVRIPPQPRYQPYTYTPPPRYVFPFGRRELCFAAAILILCIALCNCLFYAGIGLGFGLCAAGILISTFLYLRSCGHRPGRYTAALLGLCLLLTAAVPLSDDDTMKLLLICLLLAMPSLAFCLMAGRNRRSPDGVLSLLDAPRALFVFGFGRMAESGRGIVQSCKDGTVSRRGGSVVLGLLIAVPVVAVLVPLLMFADAAFEGLVELLPEFQWHEIISSALLGFGTACVFYTRGAALHHLPETETAPRVRKGLNAITVNTVLIAAALVYMAYLISQLAYFVGGFSGILPEDYTMAEYARRGFFEMGWLCAINLGLIALSMGLVTAKGKAPLLTKLLCLFLGAVTLFLVAAASAKMLLYIGSYGLTRLRVLTEVFMLWLAAVTVAVCVWIFRSKTAYMKFAVILALILWAALMTADVDRQVARYNVRSYQSGKLETVDVYHLGQLSDSAVPYLLELTEAEDALVANRARNILRNKAEAFAHRDFDLRSWNLPEARARKLLDEDIADFLPKASVTP